MILTHGANSLARFVEIGGRRYPVVKIGSQLWIAENLDYKFDVNGSQIPIGLNVSPSTPAAWYYDNDETTYGIDGTYKCGLLYNWYAVNYLETNKNTLLPEGWHVPSSSDFNTLATAVGGLSIAGTKLKALNNSITTSWPSDWNGTNDYGFNAIPAGRYVGYFQRLGTRASFITTTLNDNNKASDFRIESGAEMSETTNNSLSDGNTIRLVKDIT